MDTRYGQGDVLVGDARAGDRHADAVANATVEATSLDVMQGWVGRGVLGEGPDREQSAGRTVSGAVSTTGGGSHPRPRREEWVG